VAKPPDPECGASSRLPGAFYWGLGLLTGLGADHGQPETPLETSAMIVMVMLGFTMYVRRACAAAVVQTGLDPPPAQCGNCDDASRGAAGPPPKQRQGLNVFFLHCAVRGDEA
jgi:hypothetical protein